MSFIQLILCVSLVCYSDSSKLYVIKLFTGGNSDIVNGYAQHPTCNRWTINSGLYYRTCQQPNTCFLEMPQRKVTNKNYEMRNLVLELDVKLESDCQNEKDSTCDLKVSLLIYRANSRPETLTVKPLKELRNDKFRKFFSLKNSAIINGLYFRITPTNFCGQIYDVRLYIVSCAQITRNMVVFPDYTPRSKDTNVTGKCIPNAVFEHNTSVPTAECTTSNGNAWYTIMSQGKCTCMKGYTKDKEDEKCIACGDGEYKSTDGNHKCSKCGESTISNKTHCVCMDGYVRRVAENSNDDCYKRSWFGVCSEEKIKHGSQIYVFPKTMVRQNVSLPCHYNKKYVVTRRCKISWSNTAKWKSPDWSMCNKTEKVSLQELEKVEVTVENAQEVSRALSKITANSTHINTESELDSATTIMENCLNTTTDKEVVINIMSCVDNVVKINKSVIGRSKNLNQRILKVLDDGAKTSLDNPIFYSGSSFTFAITNTTGNRDFNAVVSNKKDISKEYCNTKIGIDFTSIEKLSGHGNKNIKYTNMAAIQIPKSTFEETNLSEADVYVYAFKNDNLFPSNQTTTDGNAKTVVSYIFATTVYNKTFVHLENGIVIKFKVKTMQQAIEGICSYWETSEPSAGYWSTNGCIKTGIETTIDQNIYILCKCTHLTNFAILFNVYNTDHTRLKSQHALNIVTFVGCTISMVCLIATLVCYLGIREIRRKTARKILINFCFSLLCLLATFLFGIDQAARPVVCHAVATLLHLFTISTFCWMSVQAIFLYKKAVRATENRGEGHRTYHVSFISSWGFSIVMSLATCYFTIPQFNGENRNSYCVITGMIFNITILTPVSFLIFINYVLFFPVIREIQKHMTTRGKLQKSQIALRRRFKVTLSCTTLLGLTWVFGFFAIDDLREPFQWLFCLSNSLQGTFIFIFHVLLNEKLRETWKKTILPNSKTGSTGDQSKSPNGTGSYRKGATLSTRASDRNSAAIFPWKSSSTSSAGEKTLSLVDN